MNNKIAVVTGGSRGIGKEIVRSLAREGYDVAFNYINGREGAEQLHQEVLELGVKCLIAKMDVCDSDSVNEFFSLVDRELGEINLLVNNAGITRDGLLASLSITDITRVIQTNLIGTLLCTQQVIPSMMRHRKGAIVNISSVAAQKPGKGQSNYAAAKGGIESFTRALAVELAPRNIRVNAVAPGIVNTEMSQELINGNASEIHDRLLVKRYAEPEEIAAAVLFLANSNSYITGEILPINGGLKMA